MKIRKRKSNKNSKVSTLSSTKMKRKEMTGLNLILRRVQMTGSSSSIKKTSSFLILSMTKSRC